MRILVDSSNYLVDNDNLGDRAIFQVLGDRLLDLWPDASVQFITGNPGLIEQTHPGLRPLVLGPRPWLAPDQCFAAVEAADLVLATGGGYYSDAFAAHAVGVLNTLEAACQLGKPAVMMSAGFEPVHDEALLARARSVLPRLALIACREGATGPAYLRSLGVQPRRVVVTGDDTVELAHEARRAELGDAIGVNLRQAPYACMDDRCIDVLRTVLIASAQRHYAPLVPVPISLHGPSDMESIANLLGSTPAQAGCARPVNTPQAVLEVVSQCRLVVTGSYHAAVFALSQGIPVVGLIDSLHYRTKLGGLAHQFGAACTLLAVRDESFGEELTDAIDRAWMRAEEFRPGLLAAAIDQITAGQAAYRRLPGLLQPRDSIADNAFRGVRASPLRPATVASAPDVSLFHRALGAVTRERDALQQICDERAEVIKELAHTCALRQRQIEDITAEAQRRDHANRQQAAALADLRQTLDERTAWAERMVLEAERRGEVIAKLEAAVAERTAWAERMVLEAERRGEVIAELQAAIAEPEVPPTPGPRTLTPRTYGPRARLIRRMVGLGVVWCAVVRNRVASHRFSRIGSDRDRIHEIRDRHQAQGAQQRPY